MAKQKSTNQRIRDMLERGATNKQIVAKLQVTPQAVYNVRYRINKAQGLGAIRAVTVTTPPKQRVKKSVPVQLELDFQDTKLPELPDTSSLPSQAVETVQVCKKPEPRPSLWQRIVRWVRG